MIDIRDAVPEDYETVADLTVIAYIGGGFVDAHSPYAVRLRDTASRAEKARVRVAEMNGEVVGSVTLAEPATPYADVAQDGELEFRMLAVTPDARGCGVGSALVRDVLDIAYDQGCRAVVMSTQADMADARRIYERNGFVPAPERNWSPPSGEELTVLVREIV
ncbi:GNAT family N-acetyltransferase [Rhodococcus triatomae]|nr:GNAT family N-acetyltransferase [Rhodococcus triatomae]QNG19282.1 GNAT family N-acetyltransferase [Rhodococcus triatomae]QNG24805.1 GNAT family N-acetyltransferase [Rhodococcus triatomae]